MQGGDDPLYPHIKLNRMMKDKMMIHARVLGQSRRMPAVLTITVLIVIGWFVATTSLVLIARSERLPVDPFAAYADILPGHVKGVLLPLGFRCHTNSDLIELCALSPIGSPVESILVVVRYNVILSVSFRLRSVMRLGDLALLWDSPEVRPQGEYATHIIWSHLNASVTITPLTEFSYLLPVETVTFGEFSLARIRAL